jgi:hypothetical protein
MKEGEYVVRREGGYWLLRKEGSNVTIKCSRAKDWQNFLEALGE